MVKYSHDVRIKVAKKIEIISPLNEASFRQLPLSQDIKSFHGIF